MTRIVALFLGVGLAIACPGEAAAAADTTVTAEPGGMAAGRDIKNNTINQTINKIDLTNLPEFVKVFSDRENAGKELLDEARRKRDEIAANLKIAQGAVESLGPDTTPTEVARKHAISSGLLYTWRQQLLGAQIAPPARSAPTFAQVEIAGASSRLEAPDRMPVELAGSAEPPSLPRLEGLIEIVLPDGVTLRVDAQVDGRALRRVLGALEGR